MNTFVEWNNCVLECVYVDVAKINSDSGPCQFLIPL